MFDENRSFPGQIIVVNNEPLLVDCGPGASMNLMKTGINPLAINRIFLTHLHIDHSCELPSLVFASCLTGKREKLYLYGPQGTLNFYRLLTESVYPYTAELMPRIRKGDFEVLPTEASQGVVCQTENYRVLTAPVEHSLSAIAFRIESKDGIVVVSGDTGPSEALTNLARGADLLIHECSFPDDLVKTARITAHSVASDVGEVANRAGVKKVLLTHLFPQCKGREQELIKSVNKRFGGEVTVSHDLLEVNV
jgi:ribonuclease BN (tRNA processing enzyme)